MEALQDSGREFVTRYLDAYDLTAAEGALLLELGQIVDRLSEVRALRVDPLGVHQGTHGPRSARTGLESVVRKLQRDAETGDAMRPKGLRAPALDDHMRTLLLNGPWRVGLDLATAPAHESLRLLWQAHEAELLADAQRRGIAAPWFLARDEFVRMIER